MAHLFKEASTCLSCLRYLERPVMLKCGYICCLKCTETLERGPQGEGILCPNCSVVSLKENITPHLKLENLVTKIKNLEPQLKRALQMNPSMKLFQVAVTLDVDTAHNHLVISDDLRSVYYAPEKQSRKDCAERFSVSTCVLGSSRFTSGRHYWEVVVGTCREWDVGVCKESVSRQDPVHLSEERGFWTVGVRDGQVYAASTEPLTQLVVNPRLHRVGIFLDLLAKSVSFWDLSDGSHVFTFYNVSDAEPFRPFFAPANSYPDDQEVISICPVMNPGIWWRPVDPEQGNILKRKSFCAKCLCTHDRA